MNIAIVFEPDTTTPDPDDPSGEPLQRGAFVGSGTDAFVVWREWGEQFTDGYRTHVMGTGIWENLTPDQIESALASLEDE